HHAVESREQGGRFLGNGGADRRSDLGDLRGEAGGVEDRAAEFFEACRVQRLECRHGEDALEKAIRSAPGLHDTQAFGVAAAETAEVAEAAVLIPGDEQELVRAGMEV